MVTESIIKRSISLVTGLFIGIDRRLKQRDISVKLMIKPNAKMTELLEMIEADYVTEINYLFLKN